MAKGQNRIDLVETETTPEKPKRTRSVNPPSLLAMGKAARILESLTRRERINVVNFLTTHFALNEPVKDTTDSGTN